MTTQDAPPTNPSKSFARAWEDIRTGVRSTELWGHLGWQDIKQRYRRSVIGPLWITLGMAVTAIGLGLLYSQLLGQQISTFLPYITVGFIVWNFIVGCVIEGTETFIRNEGLIKHLPAPLTVYALRTVWRQTLMMLHNLLVYVVLVAIFFPTLSEPYRLQDGGHQHPGLSWLVLLAIPAFLLLAFNGVWVTLFFGIISTRYRDIPQVINAFIQLVFFGTPIVWTTDTLLRFSGGDPGTASWRVLIAELNPMYHYVEIIRAPLIGNEQSWHHWAVVGGFTVFGWILAVVALRNFRARIPYWV
ncbi:ABC transporter permease [Actinocrispum sp. NPDC049592]|uniref:galactan export ABC transporter permease subunit Wzm/RfbD n=1 Tax=Actinocrispum sp. NPDC049592 TaxID=3154835 RepID=UPI003438F02A